MFRIRGRKTDLKTGELRQLLAEYGRQPSDLIERYLGLRRPVLARTVRARVSR